MKTTAQISCQFTLTTTPGSRECFHIPLLRKQLPGELQTPVFTPLVVLGLQCGSRVVRETTAHSLISSTH